MRAVKALSIGCLSILAALAVVAVILWRGGTGIGFLDSAVIAQKRAIIAGQCVERVGLPKPQCDCMAGALATLPVSDVMSAIQSAQSADEQKISSELEKHRDFLGRAIVKCDPKSGQHNEK